MQDINLIPSGYIEKEEKRKQITFVFAVLAISLVLTGSNYFSLFLRGESYKRTHQIILKRWQEVQGLHSELEQREIEVQKIQEEREVIRQLLQEEGGKVLLDTICQGLPSNIWLKEIYYFENPKPSFEKNNPVPVQAVSSAHPLYKPDKEGVDGSQKGILTLKGEAISGTAVAELLMKLEESKELSEPKLEFISSDSSRPDLESNEEVVKWTINCELR